MLKSFILLGVVVSVALCQTATPLTFVDCDPDYDDCIYKAGVVGTVQPGEWMYYSVDLDSVSFSTAGDNTTELDFWLYLWEAQTDNIALDYVVGTNDLPTTSSNEYEDSCNNNCYSSYSYSDCSPSKTTWYVGVYNKGSTVIPFEVEIYYGSEDGWCDDWDDFLKFILILVLCLVGGVLLLGICIVATLCMCCGLSCALCCSSKKKGYVQIETPAQPPSSVAVTVQPPSGPYPPLTAYPGPANIQTHFPPYNSAQGYPTTNPYYYSNTVPQGSLPNQV